MGKAAALKHPEKGDNLEALTRDIQALKTKLESMTRPGAPGNQNDTITALLERMSLMEQELDKLREGRYLELPISLPSPSTSPRKTAKPEKQAPPPPTPSPPQPPKAPEEEEESFL